jgi:hypothetical protein
MVFKNASDDVHLWKDSVNKRHVAKSMAMALKLG